MEYRTGNPIQNTGGAHVGRHGVALAFANVSVRTYALMETLLSLMIFFGVLFFVRLSKIHS
jgi:uncharacterized membrane protein